MSTESSSRRDVVVIGGGTVGLYAAAKLSRRRRVTLLEGDLDASQLLGIDPQLGRHRGATHGWASGLGGTSQLWGGQLWPWQSWEIESGSGHCAWPIEYNEDLSDHYDSVLLGLGLGSAHSAVHTGHTGDPRFLQHVANSLDARYSTWMTHRQKNFATNRNLAVGLSSCCILSGVRVEYIEPKAGQFRLHARTSTDDYVTYDASCVILASGTLGNTKLLTRLLEPDSRIGAGFVDHVSTRAARLEIDDWNRFSRFAASKFFKGVRTSLRMVPTRQFLSDSQSLPGFGHFEFESDTYSSLSLLTGARGGTRATNPEIGRVTRAFTQNLPSLARSACSAIRHKERPVDRKSRVYLRIDVEQAPNETSRLRWLGERGREKLSLQWTIGPQEHKAAASIRDLIADSELPGARVTEVLDQFQFVDTFHLMGGTVMGTPGDGSVVSPDLEVHGIPGLFVAGASVFPSGGMANPTFTALALTDRLVAHVS